MSDVIERLSRLRLDAVVAIENADFATAYQKLLACKTIFDLSPSRQEKDGLAMEYREILSLLAIVEKERDKAAGAGKLRRINVTHAPLSPPNCSCY